MKIIFYSTIVLALISANTHAQVQIDKAIDLNGTGSDAKITGIKEVSGAQDAVSVEALQKGNFIYGGTSVYTVGTNTYAVTVTPALAAYIPGLMINFKADLANTGTPPTKVKIGILVPVDIVKDVSSNLAANDIAAGQLVTLIYDGTRFQLLSRTFDGGGTVTSAGLALPGSVFSVSGSPVTTAGTLTGSFVNQTANQLFAAPDGAGGTPGFRALTANDIPSISAAKIASGILAVAQGGTNNSAIGSNGQVAYSDGAKYVFTTGGTAGYLLQYNGAAAPTWVDGSGLFIKNQTAQQASSNFNISGSGTIGATAILGTGDGTATVAGGTLRAPARTGTDAAGTNLIVQPGNGTGTGGSGSIFFQTAASSGTSGAVANAMANKMILDRQGTLSIITENTGPAATGALKLGCVGSNCWTNANGIIGFSGAGTAHGQMSFYPNSGAFAFVNSSASDPSGDYGVLTFANLNFHDVWAKTGHFEGHVFGTTFIGADLDYQLGPATNADNQYHTVQLNNGYGLVTVSIYATGSSFDGDMKINGLSLTGLLNDGGRAWYSKSAALTTIGTTTGDPDANNVYHWAYCPNNYIATGVEAWAAGNLDFGLKLRCTPLISGYLTTNNAVTTQTVRINGTSIVTTVTCSGVPSANASPFNNGSDDIMHTTSCPAGTFVKGLYIYSAGALDGGMFVSCTGIKPN